MRVQCVNNQVQKKLMGSFVNKDFVSSIGSYGEVLDLTVNKSYIVYAIEVRDGHLWYFIADDLYESLSYPLAYASIFFSKLDSRVSNCWLLDNYDHQSHEKRNITFAFKEWVEDSSFFELLIDGSDHEVTIFQKYKEFMDLEYPYSEITEKAIGLEGDWVMCPMCSEAWEVITNLGMTSCPKCNKIMLNPRYLKSPIRD